MYVCVPHATTGTTLNFGVMIGKLKRDKLMKDVLEVRLSCMCQASMGRCRRTGSRQSRG